MPKEKLDAKKSSSKNLHPFTPPLDDREAASFLGVAVQTMRNWRHVGKGPVYHKMSDGPRGPIRYLIEDLIVFRDQRRIDPEAV